MKLLRRGTVGLLLVALLGASGIVCARTAERGRYATAYSTYGAGPEGTRGAFLLVPALGRHAVRWVEDFGPLSRTRSLAHATIVAVGGCDAMSAREMTEGERKRLDTWVRGGGTLIVAGANGYLSGPELGVTLDRTWVQCAAVSPALAALLNGDDAGAPALPALANPGQLIEDGRAPVLTWAYAQPGPLAPLGAVGLRQPAPITTVDEAHASVLLRDDEDESVVRGVVVRRGHGTVVVLASGSPFQNRDLRAADGGPLLARLLDAYATPGAPVLFDEYHLGVGDSRSTMRYLGDLGVGPFVAQLLAVVALALWRAGARFGAARTPVPPPPAGTASYVAGIASLYAKTKDPGAALSVLARGACARIAAHHHVQGADETQLAAALEKRGRKDAAASVKRIAEVRASVPKDERTLVSLAKEIDQAVHKATV